MLAPMRARHLIPPLRQGFTLLEMSISVAILSIVAVAGLEMSGMFLSSTAYKTTQTNADALDAALVRYRAVYGRLPCPAKLSLPMSDPQYGVEDCTTVSPAVFDGSIAELPGGVSSVTLDHATFYTSPAGSYNVTFSGSATGSGASATATLTDTWEEIAVDLAGYSYNVSDVLTATFHHADGTPMTATEAPCVTAITISSVKVGAIPVRTLGLPISYAVDGFGSKYFYYVSTSLTKTSSFAPAAGVIQVRAGQLAEPCAGSCSVLQGGAAYAIISPGKDQRGGYSKRGQKVLDCVPADYTTAIDAQNCYFEGASNAITPAQPLGVVYNSTFNNGSSTSQHYTDDIVVTRLKSDL